MKILGTRACERELDKQALEKKQTKETLVTQILGATGEGKNPDTIVVHYGEGVLVLEIVQEVWDSLRQGWGSTPLPKSAPKALRG